MQQVSDWLEKLGLGQYAQRFAENDIDFALLMKLTDANLKELGVTSLGHRMRLLEAIAERAGASAATTLAEPKAPDAAERRQVTVIFSDPSSKAISRRTKRCRRRLSGSLGRYRLIFASSSICRMMLRALMAYLVHG